MIAPWASTVVYNRPPTAHVRVGTCVEEVLKAEGGETVFIRRLLAPASDSQMEMALGLAAVALSLMLWALLWQSDVIHYQRDVIRALASRQLSG